MTNLFDAQLFDFKGSCMIDFFYQIQIGQESLLNAGMPRFGH
jgi:hypothetical protein